MSKVYLYSIAPGVDPVNPPRRPPPCVHLDEDSESDHGNKIYSDCEKHDSGSDYDELVSMKERAHTRYMQAAELANTAIVALKKENGATQKEIMDYLKSKHGVKNLNNRFPNGQCRTWDVYVKEYLLWARRNGTLIAKPKGAKNTEYVIHHGDQESTDKNTMKISELSKELNLAKEEIERLVKENERLKKTIASHRCSNKGCGETSQTPSNKKKKKNL